MGNACPEAGGRVSQVFEFSGHFGEQVIEIVQTGVRQIMAAQSPDSFIGIEFRGIRRKRFEMQPGKAPTQRANRLALVLPAVVPQHDDRPSQMAQEMTQKRDRLALLNVLPMDLVVQPNVSLLGTHRNGRDDRELLARRAVCQDWRLTDRCPGPRDTGNQLKARLVQEDQMGLQACNFFFTRGHAWVFHRAIAAASRSIARRSGFCTLHPSRWSSRPMESW